MRQIITLFFALMLFNVYAQSPQSFNYQGVARDASGNPVSNTTISIRASILSDSVTGTAAYSEIQKPTSNQFGLFTIAIGNGTVQSGVFANIPWSIGKCYLKIEVDPTGGSNYALSGTSQILSVPYALYAANGTQWSSSDTNLYYNKGYIGLGSSATTSPNRPLQIIDSLAVVSLIRTNNSYFSAIDYVPAGNLSSTNAAWTVGLTPSSNSFNIYNWVGNNSNYVFSITNIGNVGIGTTTPNSAFEVANGDVQIDNIGSGVIMKSPNGSCFRIAVNDSGSLTSTAIACP